MGRKEITTKEDLMKVIELYISNKKIVISGKQNKTKNMHTTNSLSYIVGMGELLWDMLPDGKKVGG